MSGAVRRRPGWKDIRPTWQIIGDIPSIVRKLFAGGDDAVLQMVIGLFQGMGCRVVGVHEILPDLLADVGSLGRVTPTPADLRDIDAASEAAHILGRLDVGQGAVSVGGRVVALEGAEGTDAMLVRVAELRQIGRISRTRRGVLVKMCKPQQDMRVDLPTIGPSTVQAALEAGLAGIAVEAGRALVLERSAVLEMADSAGIFVCGIDLACRKRDCDAAATLENCRRGGRGVRRPSGWQSDCSTARLVFRPHRVDRRGGDALQAEGLTSLFDFSELSIMGLTQILKRLPQLFARIRQTVAAIVEVRPDLLLIIDSPDFTHRVAKRVRQALPELPVVDYVCPSVWAWKEYRATQMLALSIRFWRCCLSNRGDAAIGWPEDRLRWPPSDS